MTLNFQIKSRCFSSDFISWYFCCFLVVFLLSDFFFWFHFSNFFFVRDSLICKHQLKLWREKMGCLQIASVASSTLQTPSGSVLDSASGRGVNSLLLSPYIAVFSFWDGEASCQSANSFSLCLWLVGRKVFSLPRIIRAIFLLDCGKGSSLPSPHYTFRVAIWLRIQCHRKFPS